MHTPDAHLVAHLNALAQALGLNALTLDAEGLRSLSIGNELTVHIQSDTATQELVLFAEVGMLPSASDTAMLTLLLRANRFWRGTGGATLSLDEQSPPGLVLARRISCAATTPAQFVAQFESFADHLADWSARLNAPPQAIGTMPHQFA